MKILLVQHGLAKSKEEAPERPLTDAGVRKTKKVAAWLGKQIIHIEEIHHSGKKRAAQTAEIFANRLAPTNGTREVAGLNPNDDVRSYADQLQSQDGSCMVVGHLPFLDRLAALLVAEDPDRSVVSFVNSGVVCLEESQGRWTVTWALQPDIIFES